jgi:hypothetical protein
MSPARPCALDNRGTGIYKEHKHSTRRIDLAVCAIMAHSVAATVDRGLQLYWYRPIDPPL